MQFQVIGEFLTSSWFVWGAPIFILSAPWFPIFKKQKLSTLYGIALSLGILGTFLGIFGGLLQFDVQNITAGIPTLIEGLRLAFLSSIAGAISGLILKLRPSIYGFKEEVDEVDPDTQELSLIRQELEKVNKGLTGEEDSSLVTQIQKMRMSLGDKQDELNKSFKDFAEQMVNSNIDALAEAIEKVMGDFNTTVNEKLGKTFDDFKDAVENLNQWQSEYKDQIYSQTENLNTMKASFDTLTESIEKIEKSFREIEEISKKFDSLLENLNSQLQGSIDFASSMKELTSELEGSGEAIREEMKEITYGAANEMEKTMNKTLADFGSSMADISGKLAEDFSKIQRMLKNPQDK